MTRTAQAITSAILICIAFSSIAPPAQAAGPSAAVRFVHAAPDTPEVDVYADKMQLASQISFCSATNYLPIQSGHHRLHIALSGGDANAGPSIDLTIEPGTMHTIAATGLQAEVELTAIADHPNSPAADKAGLRIYHFSPDAPAVDVKAFRSSGSASSADVKKCSSPSDNKLSNMVADTMPTTSERIASNLAFPTASMYRELDPGVYDLTIFPATVDVPLLAKERVEAEAGAVASVLIVEALSKQSQLMIETVYTKAPEFVKPAVLPKTAEASESPIWLIWLALGLLFAGAALRRKRYG